jgi:peptide-methionine (S)-S-oxide reductase
VRVQFNPSIISYAEILIVFWDRIDPTLLNQQGNDRGSQYRSGIYYHDDEQKRVSHASRDKEQLKYGEPIVTEILPNKDWYPAEDYHQMYLQKGGQCAGTGDSTPIRCYG